MSGATELRALYIYTLADKTLHNVSRPLSNDFAPSFDARGERLYFLGLRGFQPRLPTDYEFDYEVDRCYGIYALALRKDLAAWLPVRTDEATAPAEEGRADAEARPARSPSTSTASPTASNRCRCRSTTTRVSTPPARV
jgi:tricorn protease-like protein